uniref:MFS transporter n=2 Tax=Nocardiaceae TaxID=85025 RepID=UPI0009EADEBA
ATQLDVLRRRMATVPGGRRDHAPTELPTITAPEPAPPTASGTDLTGKTDDPEPLSAAVRGKPCEPCPVPPPLDALLPRRALTRGTAVSVTGAGSMLTPVRAWAAVTVLALAVFAVTATEMLPIGVLPAISDDLGVGVGVAGLSVSLYGIVAGVLAPVATRWTRAVDRRTVVLIIVAVFVLGNAATALVTSYAQLLAVRFVVGIAHGLMWSIVAAVAVLLVPQPQRMRATAVTFSGISLALVFGVPAGTWMGEWVGWRGAFAALAGLTAVAGAAVVVLIPALPASRSAQAASSIRDVLRRSRIRRVLLITAAVVIGKCAAYIYIAPYLLGGVGVSSDVVGGYLLIYGIAGVAGNALAGFVSARSPMMLVVGVAVLAVVLLVLAAPMGALSVFVLVGVWGLSYSALPVLLQTAVFDAAPDCREAATSLYVLVFNVSIAGGALAGAVGIDVLGPIAPIALGAVFCALGTVAAIGARRS